jgi:hypothetical protein
MWIRRPQNDAPETTHGEMMTLREQRTRWLVIAAGVVVRIASARLAVRPGGKIFGCEPSSGIGRSLLRAV